jgi:hypothetical protein
MTEPDPQHSGPYSAEENGTCADGHPLNAYGRCEPMNTEEPAADPTPDLPAAGV